MKKLIIALILAGLAITTAPTFAKEGNKDNSGLHFGKFFHLGAKHNDQFMVFGVIKSIGSGTVVITSTKSFNVPNVANGDVTIKTDANTKVSGSGDLALSNLAVGQKVVATGKVSGSDAVAKNIVIINTGRISGHVSAKTDTSITITNALTSESNTITTNADTKVMIDGEHKTLADVQVGDSGWVKFKTVGTTLEAKIIQLFR